MCVSVRPRVWACLHQRPHALDLLRPRLAVALRVERESGERRHELILPPQHLDGRYLPYVSTQAHSTDKPPAHHGERTAPDDTHRQPQSSAQRSMHVRTFSLLPSVAPDASSRSTSRACTFAYCWPNLCACKRVRARVRVLLWEGNGGCVCMYTCVCVCRGTGCFW